MSRPRSFAAAVGLLLLPAIVLAQGNQSAPRTHTVKRGDTLWDIAKTYYNDPFLWPEIYRVNTDVVEDPHWIYPGEVLRIPDESTFRQPAPDEVLPPPPPPAPVEPAPPPKRVPSFADMIAAARTHAVRAGEYLQAPFLGPMGGPAGAGRVLHTAESQGLRSDLSQRQVLPDERVFIEPPAGVNAIAGDRFVIIGLGERLPGLGQVVEPSGVVEIIAPASEGGRTYEARVRTLFGQALPGAGIIPLDTLISREGTFPAAVADGPAMRVTWIQSNPVLPSIGRYLMLSATAADGLVAGDQVTLMRDRGVDAHGSRLSEEVIAVVQVLKVTAQGTSAIVVRQRDVGIEVGMRGVLTAKMP